MTSNVRNKTLPRIKIGFEIKNNTVFVDGTQNKLHEAKKKKNTTKYVLLFSKNRTGKY